MYIFTVRIVVLLTVLMTTAFPLHTQAAENMSELINKAGMQRMWSQRIAKAYFYLGNDVSANETKLQLEMALERFKNNHALLKAKVHDSESGALLAAVEQIFSEYQALVTKSYTQDNAARVLELSDSLLDACHAVVVHIEDQSGSHNDQIVNISGKQRMLAQRVSKFYIAYQAGFRDGATVQHLKNAVEEFESGLKQLMNEGRNTGEIDSLLAKIKKEWERISPYFLEVRKGGLPLMVLTATDEATKFSDRVTDLYVEKIAAQK